LAVIAVAGGLATYWLTQPVLSDREQIVNMFWQVQEAVERKSLSGVMRHISEDYDDGHFTKRDLARLATQGLRESGAFHVLASVCSLDIYGNQATAQVKVRFWVGDVSAEHAQRLTIWVRAEKNRNRWRVTGAYGWRRAQQAL